ncbi:MAG: hypothetical protein MUF42_05225 [Cytophagaceae bacterium]|jgi:hypothetical protein|nr:hypothetical protein [Cytophagaceae bacterium]
MFTKLLQQPMRLLGFDCIGAIASNIGIWILLPLLAESLSIPPALFNRLPPAALVCFMASFISWYWGRKRPGIFLFVMAGFNSMYTLLSIWEFYTWHQFLSAWMWIYFIAELIVLAVLIYWEMLVALRINQNPRT